MKKRRKNPNHVNLWRLTDTRVKRDLLSHFTCQTPMENSKGKYATGLSKSEAIILHKHT